MNWWQYLILVNIYLVLFYGFYVILLSRETFFQLNRVYLVAAALLSFFIPLIQANWVKSLFITQKVNYTIYTSPVMFYHFKPIQDTHLTVGQLLMAVYLGGMIFLVARFIWQLAMLKRIMDMPQASAAYSFFRKIRLGDELAENKVIAAHENVHASQWHSADILLIEAVMIINWFNPVVYLYRFAIKHIHEFIADRQAIEAGTNRESYALLLLSQTFNAPAHQLVNPFFNHSLLKQRIIMLQKNKSQRMALVKYGLSAPLFVLMLVLSSATVNNSKPVRLFDKKAEQVFLRPAVTHPEEIVIEDPKVPDATAKTKPKLINVQLSPPVAAKDSVPQLNGPIFSAVEKVPEFPGGLPAFSDYLSKNIHYPASSRNANHQGRVYVTFVVEKDGSLSGIKIARGVDSEMDAEALRVMAAMPKWIPGTQNGKTVRVAYSVPISFTLSDGNSQPSTPADNPMGGVPGTKNVALSSMGLIVTKTDTGSRSFQLSSATRQKILYVVDGKDVDGATQLNPVDIQSINVLKEKEATAIYGPKGRNGAIVVKMKPVMGK